MAFGALNEERIFSGPQVGDLKKQSERPRELGSDWNELAHRNSLLGRFLKRVVAAARVFLFKRIKVWMGKDASLVFGECVGISFLNRYV